MIHYTKQERVEAVRRKMKKLCPVCWQDTVILGVVMTLPWIWVCCFSLWGRMTATLR